MTSLYDVFSAIRDDEGDHVSTMTACLDPSVVKTSPSLEKKSLVAIATAAAFAYFLGTGENIELANDALNEVLSEGIESLGDMDPATTAAAEGDLLEGGTMMAALQSFGRQLLGILSRII